jgi:hypothetical protein
MKEGERVAVALKWAKRQPMTIQEFDKWVEMLQEFPTISTPTEEDLQASLSKAFGVMNEYLRQTGK